MIILADFESHELFLPATFEGDAMESEGFKYYVEENWADVAYKNLDRLEIAQDDLEKLAENGEVDDLESHDRSVVIDLLLDLYRSIVLEEVSFDDHLIKMALI